MVKVKTLENIALYRSKTQPTCLICSFLVVFFFSFLLARLLVYST